jgi:hypothetical protein
MIMTRLLLIHDLFSDSFFAYPHLPLVDFTTTDFAAAPLTGVIKTLETCTCALAKYERASNR